MQSCGVRCFCEVFLRRSLVHTRLLKRNHGRSQRLHCVKDLFERLEGLADWVRPAHVVASLHRLAHKRIADSADSVDSGISNLRKWTKTGIDVQCVKACAMLRCAFFQFVAAHNAPTLCHLCSLAKKPEKGGCALFLILVTHARHFVSQEGVNKAEVGLPRPGFDRRRGEERAAIAFFAGDNSSASSSRKSVFHLRAACCATLHFRDRRTPEHACAKRTRASITIR